MNSDESKEVFSLASVTTECRFQVSSRARTAGRRVGALAALLLAAGCQPQPSAAPNSALQAERPHDAAQLARGQALFMQNCARCHGERAQGDPQWRQRNPDGTFPPPPLDGSGHAWHHPYGWLKAMIHEGSAPRGNMPAWGGTLNDEQIEDLIAWFQSLWPDEVYDAWWEMEQRSRGMARQ